MKKLLLLSLVTMSINAFSAANVSIVGQEHDVRLPITVSGKVLDAVTNQLIIETATGGLNGSSMEFSFNNVMQSSVTSQNGTFTVKRGGDTALASADNKFKIGFDSAFNKTATTPDSETGLTGTTLNYLLSGNLDGERKVYTGRIDVTVNAGATAGSFSDASKVILVKTEA